MRPIDELYRIKAIEQAVAVLRAFSPEERRISLPQLAERVGVSVQQMHKVIRNLELAGLVEATPSGGYRPAIGLWQIGTIALEDVSLLEEARPVVPRLGEAARARGVFGFLRGGRVVYLDHVRSLEQASGWPLPAHATALGKALLAELSDAELRAAIAESALERHTARTITEAAALEAELARTRGRGFALEDREHAPHWRGVGAVVRDHSDRAVAALGVSGDLEQLRPARLEEVAALVVEAARGLSERLGAGRSGALTQRLPTIQELVPVARAEAAVLDLGEGEPQAPPVRERRARPPGGA